MPPYASAPHGLPGVGYGNPYAVQSPYRSSPGGGYGAGSPQTAYSPAQSYAPPPQQQPWSSQPPTPAPSTQMSPPNPQSQTQSSQMMPPPPRPNKDDRDERMNIDDIGDSMFGSGVNLKEEENYMHATFNNQHHSINNSFASTTQTTSFGSSTMSPNNSFNLLTQATSLGSQSGPDGAFAGTMGQAQTEEQIENEVKRKRSLAAREKADREQYHMNNQFLQTNAVRAKVMKICTAQAVQADVRGLYKRLDDPNAPPPRTHAMANGEQGVVAVDSRPEYTAERGMPFEQMLSLVSLAASERIRSLMDDAFALARARRYGDHGRVPPEFADIAVGEGERREEDVVPENVTGTQWDKLPEDGPNGVPANGDSGSRAATPRPQHTVSYTSSVAATLRDLAKREKAAEDERTKKREARRKRAQEAASAAEEAAMDTPASAEAAPEAAPVKMTKKEQERQKKEASKNAENLSHNTTNATAAAFALGGRGKKYSWMTGGSGAGIENKYAKPKANASGTATPHAAVKSEGASPGAAAAGASMARGASGQGRAPEWGDWREDGPGGKGIQTKDWIHVLEREGGKDKKALQRAYNKLG
jgi:hypothetical protein